MEMQSKNLDGIIYTNYGKVIKQGEQFVSDHAIGFIVSGSVRIVDGDRTIVFKEGDVTLFRKNSLAKFFKQPDALGHFRAVTVVLDQTILIDFYKTCHPDINDPVPTDAVVSLGPDELLQGYFQGLTAYFRENISEELIAHKKQELIHLLIRKEQLFKNILFDFELPGKIELESFMKKNFKYNVGLDKLAFLTGRSLASFKRDFEKIFKMSPNKWLQQQRLKEAYYLIHQKGIRPSDVYLEVGFESLSHFSYAFKQFFGKTPSSMLQHKVSD
jgi:AraC-like DNA-binding protein